MALKILKQDTEPHYLRGLLNDTGVGYYIYISDQRWNKSENIIEVKWQSIISHAYINEEGVENVSMQLSQENIDNLTRFYIHPVDVDGANFIQQGYEYLKTLPEFEGAIDC